MSETVIFWLTVLSFPCVLLGGIVSFFLLKDRLFKKPVVRDRADHIPKGPDTCSLEPEIIAAVAASPTAGELQGEVAFNYSDHNGIYVIGRDAVIFETAWSRADDARIHCYSDPPSISGVALASKGSQLSDITDASSLDYTSRVRSPEISQFAVLRNSNGFYAAIKILSIKDSTRDESNDEVRFHYWILPDGSDDFSNLGDDALSSESPIENSRIHSKVSEEQNNLPYSMTEVEIGTLRSNIANYPVSYEVFRFRGKLLAEVTLDYGHGATLQRLYEKADGKYLVYVEQDHRHDYWTSSLAGAMVGGESELPLSIEDVQERFPELATEAGLSRITNI